jgi:hypothetical protein
MDKGFIGAMRSFIMRKGIMGSFIIRKAITPAIYSFSPEQDAFCSEALDENASTLRKVWNILFGRTKENKSVHYK